MTRSDLRRLSKTRLREARGLFALGFHSGSYYLAGYAVECALKACIARQIKRHEFPDKALANRVYTHDLGSLVSHAQLGPTLKAACDLDQLLQANWALTYKWNEHSRYAEQDQQTAELLLKAIGGRKHGVLSWIRQHW